jgi:two-component system, NtrC family, response regulator AtoC
MKPSLLIVDDEESVRESFRLVLQDDYDLSFAEDAKTTLRVLKNQTFNLCLLDIMLPDGSGLDLLRQMKRRDESIDVIMVTALQGIETGLDAMVGKAQDYITKPFNINELRGLIAKTLAKRTLKNPSVGINKPEPLCLMGTSAVTGDLVKKIEAAALSEKPVCLRGEKGAGVEEVAREIHMRSRRSEGPFVTFNCSNPVEKQMEGELFGEEADGKLPQVGKLEFANKGTLFLRQIDRMPLPIQDKLMGIFSTKKMFQPESGIHLPLDIRLIVSSEMDLTTKFARRFFIKDFYHFFMDRVFSVPPLREKKRDIPFLIHHVLETANRKTKTPVKNIQNKVIQVLTQYLWPGNFSELENSVEAMVFFAKKETLTMDDIPLDILIRQMDMAVTKRAAKISAKQLRRQFERIYIRKVLERHHGHQSRTAKDLRLHRNTLVGKLKELNLEEDYREIVRKRRERGTGFRDI